MYWIVWRVKTKNCNVCIAIQIDVPIACCTYRIKGYQCKYLYRNHFLSDSVLFNLYHICDYFFSFFLFDISLEKKIYFVDCYMKSGRNLKFLSFFLSILYLLFMLVIEMKTWFAICVIRFNEIIRRECRFRKQSILE